MSEHPTFSVLIPSYGRPQRLRACLESLFAQTNAPHEIIVVWQESDFATRDYIAELCREDHPSLRLLHLAPRGIVPAENRALSEATGEIIALIDDDAVAPPDWLERIASHFADPTIGAIGGPAVNHRPDDTPFPHHPAEPVGRLPWHGFPVGNMYDQPAEWRSRAPIDVDHLVGYNMALRRIAFDRFEERLKSYWQLFELDACLQVRARGFRVVFDFANVVDHFPTNTAYVGGRAGDLNIKLINPTFNLGFITAKFTPWYLLPVRFMAQLFIGRVSTPGLLAALVAARRYGDWQREASILWRSWKAMSVGWREGLRARADVCTTRDARLLNL